MTPGYSNAILEATALIAQADGLMIAAGAGMSVDSGLPDYRGDKGLWKNYAGIGEAEIPYERLSSSVAFEQIPEVAWGFFGHQLLMYRKAVPHNGYQLLREIGEQKKQGTFVITSNIDGHFIKAKFDRSRIYEVHGSIHHLQCVENCTEAIWDSDELDPVVDMAQCQLISPLPLCPECGAMARPNVAMSSDWGWNDVFAELQKKRFQDWRKRCNTPVVIELGAGSGIATIRRFSERQKVPIIRINPSESDIPKTSTGISIPMGAQKAIELIFEQLKSPHQ